MCRVYFPAPSRSPQGAHVQRAFISNRHPCRLDTPINPCPPITSLFLIDTQMATKEASPSRANPQWRMIRGTCFAPAALASPYLCGNSHFTSHSLALRIVFRTNGPLTCTEPAAAGERVTRHRISNRGGSELEIPLSPSESAINKFLIATNRRPTSLFTRHFPRPSLPLARALGIVF
jgi:hypothetical protein